MQSLASRLSDNNAKINSFVRIKEIVHLIIINLHFLVFKEQHFEGIINEVIPGPKKRQFGLEAGGGKNIIGGPPSSPSSRLQFGARERA